MAKKAKRTDGKREILIQGKHAKQLKALQQKIATIQNQQNQLVLANRETMGGVKALIDFYVEAGEQAIDYDSQRNVLTVQKVLEEKK